MIFNSGVTRSDSVSEEGERTYIEAGEEGRSGKIKCVSEENGN